MKMALKFGSGVRHGAFYFPVSPWESRESKHSTMTTYSWGPICSLAYFKFDHVVEHERF